MFVFLEIADKFSLGIVGMNNDEQISRGAMAQLISNILKYNESKGFLLDEGDFSVNFPGKPTDSSADFSAETGKDAKVFTYTKNMNEVFIVMSFDFLPEDNILGGFDELTGELTMEELTESNYGRYRGAFFKAKSAEGFYMTGQVYLVKNKLYAILVIKESAYPNEEEVKEFVGSFQFGAESI